MNDSIKNEWFKYELSKEKIDEEMELGKLPAYLYEIVYKRINAPWAMNEQVYIDSDNGKNAIVPLYGSFMDESPLYDQFFLFKYYFVYVEGNSDISSLDYNGVHYSCSKHASNLHVIPIECVEKVEITLSGNRKGRLESNFSGHQMSPMMSALLENSRGGVDGAILKAQLSSKGGSGNYNFDIYDLHIKLKDCSEFIREAYCLVDLEGAPIVKQARLNSINLYNKYLSKINTDEWKALSPLSFLLPSLNITNNRSSKGYDTPLITYLIAGGIILFIALIIFISIKNGL